VDTGGPIIGCHDAREYSLCLGNGAEAGVWYLDVLESDRAVTLFVEAVLRRKTCSLLVPSERGVAFQADGEGVFLVGKLVDEVTGVTPEREVVRVRGRGVERGARAILIVEQISGVGVTGARGRAQVMERDVRRSPTAASVERNGEGCRLREQPTPMQWI
jgi:hypothetical protein